MRKRIGLCIFSLLICLFQGVIAVQAYTGNGDLIVHITETGKCYHKAGCGALRSDIEISLEDAYVKGYLRCDRCNPPVYTGDAKRKMLREKSETRTGETRNIGNSTHSKNKSRVLLNITLICIGIFGIGAVIRAVFIVRKDSKEKKEELDRRNKEYEARRQFYESNYKGKNIKDIVGAPENVTINNTGLTVMGVVTSEKPYGDLTVYVSPNGKKYHSGMHCHGNYIPHAINRYAAILKGYSACSLCVGKEENIPAWYLQISHVVKEIKEFEDSNV